MARVGLKDLFAFPIESDKDGVVTYGEAFRVAKAIEATITPQSSEASLYADDAQVEYYAGITGYDLSFNVDDLTPQTKGKLLGYEADENGVIFETNELNPKDHAIAFRAKRSDGKYEYRVVYKARFAPTEDRYATQGESVEFQTPTITGKAMPLSNGLFGANVIESETNKAVIAGWFKKPHLPKTTTSTGETA